MALRNKTQAEITIPNLELGKNRWLVFTNTSLKLAPFNVTKP